MIPPNMDAAGTEATRSLGILRMLRFAPKAQHSCRWRAWCPRRPIRCRFLLLSTSFWVSQFVGRILFLAERGFQAL